MALRTIVERGEPVLAKKCRVVDEINEKICTLLDDMVDTMHEAEGVGLAAPQVGMLKRLCVCEPRPGVILELINPEILESEGEQFGMEGCLSVPGYIGQVQRPWKIKLRTQLRDGKWAVLELEGFAAIVASHEIDHLDGVLFIDKAKNVHEIKDDEEEFSDEELEELSEEELEEYEEELEELEEAEEEELDEVEILRRAGITILEIED